MEPAEGLFLYGVQGQGGKETVIVRADGSFPVGPGSAETGLPGDQPAAVGAKGAGKDFLRGRHLCLTTWNRNNWTGSVAAIFPF